MVISAQQRLLRTITERDWQRAVQDFATLMGWRWYHAPDNQPTSKGYVQNIRAGFPDLVLVRGDRLIFAELKRESGAVTPEQARWLAALECVPGVDAYVWKPSDKPKMIEALR